MRHRKFLSDHNLPSLYLHDERKHFVATSIPKIVETHMILSKLLNDDLAEIILDKTYTPWERCKCFNKTCILCEFACCERAYKACCVCNVKTKCPKHGTRCFGNHD